MGARDACGAPPDWLMRVCTWDLELLSRGLLFTIKAAPIMLNVRYLDNDSELLQRAFDGFEFWGGLRSLSQGLGFLANLLSLVAVSRLAGQRPEDSA